MKTDVTSKLIILAAGLLASCAIAQPVPDSERLRNEVLAVETAFARSMANRDLNAFASFVSDEAVFLNGGKPLRGKAAVLAHWQRFFAGPKAPFSWKPELVEVLASGTLAQSTGPVLDASGIHIANFYSTWRQDAPGIWRIVLDNGYDVCNCPKP